MVKWIIDTVQAHLINNQCGNYNIGSFNNKMINFNGKMLKLYDPTGKIWW